MHRNGWPRNSGAPRRNVGVAAAVLCLFALGVYGVWHTLGTAFDTTMEKERRATALTALASPPRDDGGLTSWMDRLRESAPPFELLYVKGLPVPEGTNSVFTSDPEFEIFYRAHLASPEFRKGMESASYEEIYDPGKIFELGGARRFLLFAPAVDPRTRDLLGVGLFAFDATPRDEFFRLLHILGGGAFLLFAVVLLVGRFSRDPLVGYTIAFLFAGVGIFVAYPLFEALRLSLTSEGRFSLSIWRAVFQSSQYLAALRGSIQLGIWTATLSTALGFLFAFVLGRTNIRGKKFFTAMATLPVISPPFSLTLSVILLFGNNGLVTKNLLGSPDISIYGLGGLTLVQTMGMFPIAFLTLAGILEAIDSTLEDAALDLRADRWTTFRTITLPLCMPGILSAWLLVFTNSLADFANPLILSGSFRVLSVEAYMEVTGMNRLGHGAALSLLLLLPTLSAFLAQRFWVGRKSFVTVTGKPSGRLTELTSPGVKRALVGAMVLVTLFLLALYGTIVAGCFVKNWGIDYTFSLENIREAFSRGKEALGDTVLLASAATPIAGVLAMVAAVLLVRKTFVGKRLLEGLILTPFALPGTLMGISYILAFNKPPLVLVGTAAIIVINYVVRELPVGVEGGIAALRQIDPAIEEAAADLGADAATVFRDVVLPLVRPAFISSLSYTFVRSMTAVSAVIFLISARWYHLTVLIYNFSENLRFGLASVLATALILIVLATFGLLRLLVPRNVHLTKTLGR